MSSNKRRKLDTQAAPSSAVSALSALAARRRLVANVPAKEPSSSPEPEESASARTNSFSVLQTLKRQNEPPKSPKKNGSRGPLNRGDTRASTSQGGKMSDPSTPEDGLLSSRVMYSSFLLNKNNCRTTAKGTIALKLRDSERFIAIGSFGIKVIAGEATVFGATLQPSDPIHWIHAPHCHAIPVIRTSEKTSLELHHDPNADGLRRLSRLSPLFRGIWGESKDDSTEHNLGKGRTFQIVCSSDDAPKKCVIQELSSPPAWNKKLADLVSVAKGGPFTTLVCGPKSAGKSTFSKMLANRILTSEATRTGSHGIAILDLDPGQPEYAPCGTISLVHITRPNLSAAFTHPNLDDESYRVIRCHALASMTPAAAPEHYLECVLDLLDYYRRLLRNCHLLINTPGWILGTGQDLLVEIISRVNPPEVIYMSEDGPADVVEVLRGATKRTFTTLPSQPSEFASRTAAHLRAMQAMSYFHLQGQKQLIAGLRPSWNPSPLSSIPPLQVRYSGNQRGILGILLYDYQSPSELLSQAINGMILAAVDVEDPKAFRNLASTAQLSVDGGGKDGYSAMEDFISRTTEGLPYIPNASDITLDPCFSRTIGLVLIRGIDTTTQTLQLLTPIPLQTIEQIRSQGRQIVLVHGKFDAPTWAYTEDLYGRSQQDDINADKPLEIVNEDPNEDVDEAEDVDEEEASAESEAPSDPSAGSSTALPWVEVLRGSQKRPVGSRVWRVRRDLGRNIGGD
ncbi:Polynucleotide 5'-hydroxyl-kinase GRC3 [Trichoderma lentiforme]|uniref:Polynucleotide 5'-hydroxyl-kinase GRC3 n=1 Tax=Trichoderma lentiforme TaxID=1567552 RepID=A0A9P4XCV7_9HYPO|nr:Polynucleotide 5'-hydroxyl-kinase GRC3 [Trichoderma lentiforme]